MDGRYPPPMPPHGTYYPTGQPQPIATDASRPGLQQMHTLSAENVGPFIDPSNPDRVSTPSQSNSRSQRRKSQGQDHVKHRRTRSGCYTCRQRRVKCDEARPICKRCRKGERECQYPDRTASSKAARNKLKSKEDAEASSPSADEDDRDDKEPLATMVDADYEQSASDSSPTSSSSRKPSDTSTVSWDKAMQSPAESSSTATRRQSRQTPLRSSSRPNVTYSIVEHAKWASLPSNVKWYLEYHRTHLSYHHYGFKYDSGNFLKETFLHIALGDEALLYAVVAFAAYFHTLSKEDGKVQQFLQYYDKSVTILLSSLERRRKLKISTLLCVLQLATIEEFLGDWVNLIGHQRAAQSIITGLFTPETIMQDDTRRKIINWYLRFDLFAGIMGGSETVLSREWFAAASDFYKRQADDRPHELGARFESWFSRSRLLATDAALLFAQKAGNLTSDEDFANGMEQLEAVFNQFGLEIGSQFNDPACFVTAFPLSLPPGDREPPDYQEPKFLFGGDYYPMNLVFMDYWAALLMFRHQLAMARGQPPGDDFVNLALKKCKMFEAVEHYQQGPPGAILGLQASLGIAALFLPKDAEHTTWCRRKFALIEQKGYIYPSSLRRRMSDMWGEDVTHWWLPDEDTFPAPVRNIRDFIESRFKEQTPTNISEMSGIFKSLNVESPAGTRSTPSSGPFSPSILDPSLAYEGSTSPDR